MRTFFISFFFLFSLIIPKKAGAQGCTGISFSFEHYEPCHFRAKYNNSSDCFNEIRYSLQSGSFLTWTVNSAAGFTVDVISPSELWIHNNLGYLPLGNQVPLLFTLPTDLNTTMDVTFNDQCAQLGCVIFGGFPIESCPDPQDASIIGVKYRECGSSPYSNQPLIPNWPIQLLDTMGTVLNEVLTDSMGAYQFYDLHAGQYVIKEAQNSGWTPKVPTNGQYAVSLNTSQQVVRNFGNCPDCSCDRIYTNIAQCPTGWDTIGIYAFSISNTGGYCFNQVDITSGSDSISNWTIMESGWTVTRIGINHLRLFPTASYIPTGGFFPLRFNVKGSNQHNITVSTSWVNNGAPETCSNNFSFPFPPQSNPLPCCPPGSQFGPEQVVNGDFESGNQSFTSDFTFFTPGTFAFDGKYSVLNQSQVFMADKQWACLDHTNYSPTGNMLVVDGDGGTNAWLQTVNVVAGVSYSFSAWFNNLVYPPNNLSDPQVALYVNNTQVAGPQFLTEINDVWFRLCGSWTATTTGPVTLSIKMLSTADTGNDVAIDDISFVACIPSTPCSVAISTNPSPFCGTGVLTANATGTGPFTYQWSHGQSTQSINVQGLACGTVCSVSVTCADGSVSTASYTFSDNVPPVAICNPGIGVILDPSCQYHVTPAFVDGGSMDNCGIKSLTVNPTVLSGCGNNIVTLTVTDHCGNTSSCTMGVQTIETVPPTINCPPNLSANAVPPLCSTVLNDIGFQSVGDNCGLQSITYTINNGSPGSTNASGTVFQQGTSIVEYTAQDMCGNTATCSFLVTITCHEEDCACTPGVASSPSLVANGDFSSGATGFTSGLLGPYFTCGTGSYGIVSNFSSFCTGWQNYGASSPPNFMAIDGSANPGITNLWESQVNLVSNMDYCFSFKWALGFANAQQNFPISIDIVDASGNVIQSGAGHIGTQVIVNNLTWTSSSFNWNSGTLPAGPWYVAIRQLSGGLYRDFGIDDICFTKVSPCTADFNFQAIGCTGKYNFNGFANGSGPYTYLWTFDDPNSGADNTSTLQNPMHQFSAPGTYQVTLKVTDVAGCMATYSATITVPPFFTVSISGNQSVCSGQSVLLTATGNGAGLNYIWSPGGQTTQAITVTPTIQAHTYSVIVTDANGCTATATTTISINPLPNILLQDQFICSGENATLVASGGASYQWSNFSTTPSINISPTVTTTYTVTVTNLSGCSGTGSATVHVEIPMLNSGLTGYFPFNLPNIADDVSATQANGTPFNITPAIALNGQPSAASFNGTSSYIYGTNNNRGVVDKVSVVAWVKTTETQKGLWVAGQYMGGTSPKGYLLSIGDVNNNNIGQPSFSGRVDQALYSAAIAPPSQKVNDGNWHCLVGTAANNTWKIYVDGNMTAIPGPTTPSIDPVNWRFSIGVHSDIPNSNNGPMWFNGDMDDIRVYNRELTKCEVDAVCSTSIVSGIKDISNHSLIRIIPNPNLGVFSVQLPEPATATTRIRIINISGQVLAEYPTQLGLTLQQVDAGNLPQGLYFLQVISDGNFLATEKFVKQ